VLGPNGKQKDQGLSLEDLLPRKFFADSVSDDHPKAAGSARMFLAEVGIHVYQSCTR
jgi:hypothetical protein